jgi:8-oxo-dGTP pyrophosphatase MutT (NUDIX family)
MPSRKKPGRNAAPGVRPPLRREFSAGGIVWRRGARGGIEIAMIRPRGTDSWALPKGHVEQAESMEQAAVREVREETGLRAGAVEKLGDISYVFSWRDAPAEPPARIFKRVRFFLMQFAGGEIARQHSEVDEAAWVEIGDAIARATYKSERELIEKARAMLRGRGAGE